MRRAFTLLRFSAVTVIISAILFTAACRKSKTPEDTGYAADNATSEQTFSDVQSIADQASTLPSGSSMGYKTTGSGCATVTKVAGNPNTITIDFGPTDCICKDGRKRRGKIIITYTGEYNIEGSVHTITFDNYYQNDNKVTGTKTVTNMGLNSLGQPYFTIVENGSVTKNGGGTVTTQWSKTRTQTAGYGTTDVSDDVYEITGSGVFTTANGKTINITIIQPLVVAMNCRWVEAGSVKFAIASGEYRVLNYGDTPNCDDNATITLGNGTMRTITLP